MVLAFLALVVLWESVFTFTVYADALASSFGLSSLSISAVFSVGTAAFFVAGGLVGILVARLPLRPVVLSAGAVEILTSVGIARSVAVTAFGLVGGVSIASRVASGGIADWLGSRRTLAGGVVLTALGLFVLSVVVTVPTMYVALATFGVGLGAIAALYAPIVIRAFGPANATAVAGIFTFCSATAGFLGPVAIDALATEAGGYGLPLAALGVFTLAGAGLFFWGTDPDVGG